MDQLSDKLIQEQERTCKKPWTEYEKDMRDAGHTLKNAMGNYAWDTEYRQIKGYVEGYLAGVSRMKSELDL